MANFELGSRYLVPLFRRSVIALLPPSYLPLLELLQEAATKLKVRPARVDVLQGFEQRPVVLLHEVHANDTRCSALAPYRMDQHTIVLLGRFLDEVMDLLQLVPLQLPVII